MAVTQSKRSVHRTQPPRRAQSTNKADRRNNPRTRRPASPYRKLVHFPRAKGKIVEDVEFSSSPDYHNISINFQDKTSLNFSIETGFTLETDYSNWKSGN